MGMKLTYWGVRGSLPASPTPDQWSKTFAGLMSEFFKAGHKGPEDINKFVNSLHPARVGGWGGNTTCVEVETSTGTIIIDGGSGIRNLSEKIVKRLNKQKPIHIFMTHFHWDHMIGIPFFIPIFIPGVRVQFYAVQPELEYLVRGIFKKPYFPVPFESLPSSVTFKQLLPRQPLEIDGIKITPYQLDHPDPCWGFKVEGDGKTYAHCVDTEGNRVTREQLGADLPLYQGVDCMYYDAQYTLPELAEKANWGHSAAQIGLDIAMREGIKTLLFAHHDPGASIEQIFEVDQAVREYYDWKIKSPEGKELAAVDWQFATEGMKIEL